MSRSVSLSEVFDNRSFTPYQVWVCSLCFLLVFLDGFDLTVIGVALPKIAEHLNSKPAALGLALSAGQLGPMLGAITLGMFADRWGRKLTLILSAVIFGVFTFMTAYITTVEQLALYRFLAGIGLGGAIPNALAFGTEYAPSKMRATLATTMFAGMPVGSAGAGISASYLLPHFGWQSVFYVGGIAPIVIALAVFFCLPESLSFLVRRGRETDRLQVRGIVAKIAPSLVGDERVKFHSTETKLPGVPVKHLFTGGRGVNTILLWVLFLFSFYLLWILLSWAPTMLKKSGATVQQYSIAFACLSIGSALATITIGRLMDRFNKMNVLKTVFVIAFFSLIAFGWFSTGTFLVVAAFSIITGLFVNGGNSGLMGLAAVQYPSDIRATGVGWAYGVGKIGSLFAPAIGGLMIAQNWTVFKICSVNAFGALLIALIIMILQKHQSTVAENAIPQPSDVPTAPESA